MATGWEGRGLLRMRNRGAVVNEAEDAKSRSNYKYVKSQPFQMMVANIVTDTSEGSLRKVPRKGRDGTCTTQPKHVSDWGRSVH